MRDITEASSLVGLSRLLEERRSWLGFSGGPVTVGQIEEIARLATLTPSEENLQPWRLVVHQGAALARLLPALLGSNVPKATDAGTAIVFAGDLAAVERSEVATRFYETRRRRDFAVRNTSLYLMTFMLVAQASGVVTRPLAGFDEAAVADVSALRPDEIPVAVLLLGGTPDQAHPQPRGVRRPVGEFLRIARMSPCRLCAVGGGEADVVTRGAGWHARIFPTLEVPGWLVLQLDRHAEGLAAMTTAEASGLGEHLRALCGGIEESTGADTIYATCFGEVNRHLHFLVAARPADVPPDDRGGRLLEQAPRLRDVAAARRVAAELRVLLGGAS